MREKAQGGRLLAHNSGFTMPGSPIPNDNGLLVRDRVPLSQVLQKINGVVTVASTLMPDETLTMAKITSPYRLSRFLREEKCWAPNRVPLRLTNGSLTPYLNEGGLHPHKSGVLYPDTVAQTSPESGLQTRRAGWGWLWLRLSCSFSNSNPLV